MSPHLCHEPGCSKPSAGAVCISCPTQDRSIYLCFGHAVEHHQAGHNVMPAVVSPPPPPAASDLRTLVGKFLPELREALAAIPDDQIAAVMEQIDRLIQPIVDLSHRLDHGAALSAADTVDVLTGRGWDRREAMELVLKLAGESTGDTLQTAFEMFRKASGD